MPYLPMGQEAAEAAVTETPQPSVEERLAAHSAALARIERTTTETLRWRKIATGAAIAGALFAAIRLTDIWLAVKARKRAGSS